MSTVEALNHGGQKPSCDEPVERERVTGPPGEKRNEGQLRPAIAITKRVDRVERRQESGSLLREPFGIKISERSILSQSIEKAAHLTIDIFGIAERTAALRDSNGSVVSRPRVHILKQVTVNSLVVPNAEPTRGKRLRGSLRRNRCFEAGQRDPGLDARKVSKDAAVRIAIGIGGRPVHSGL